MTDLIDLIDNLREAKDVLLSSIEYKIRHHARDASLYFDDSEVYEDRESVLEYLWYAEQEVIDENKDRVIQRAIDLIDKELHEARDYLNETIGIDEE